MVAGPMAWIKSSRKSVLSERRLGRGRDFDLLTSAFKELEEEGQ